MVRYQTRLPVRVSRYKVTSMTMACGSERLTFTLMLRVGRSAYVRRCGLKGGYSGDVPWLRRMGLDHFGGWQLWEGWWPWWVRVKGVRGRG